MQMKHSEELIKVEEQKNQAKDEAHNKLLKSMQSGNAAQQKAAQERPLSG